MNGRVKRLGVAALIVGAISIGSVQEAQAYTSKYFGRYPTYQLCDAAGQRVGGVYWECIYSPTTHFWSGYSFS